MKPLPQAPTLCRSNRQAGRQDEGRQGGRDGDLEDRIAFDQVGDELGMGEGLDGQPLLAPFREHLFACRFD